jgi:hypothetical protein
MSYFVSLGRCLDSQSSQKFDDTSHRISSPRHDLAENSIQPNSQSCSASSNISMSRTSSTRKRTRSESVSNSKSDEEKSWQESDFEILSNDVCDWIQMHFDRKMRADEEESKSKAAKVFKNNKQTLLLYELSRDDRKHGVKSAIKKNRVFAQGICSMFADKVDKILHHEPQRSKEMKNRDLWRRMVRLTRLKLDSFDNLPIKDQEKFQNVEATYCSLADSSKVPLFVYRDRVCPLCAINKFD